MRTKVGLLIRALMLVAVFALNYVGAPPVKADACQDCKTCVSFPNWFTACCKPGSKYSSCYETDHGTCRYRKCGSAFDDEEEGETDPEGGEEEMY